MRASLPANLIGFSRAVDRDHYEAVKAENARPARRADIRSLATLAVISNDEQLRNTAQLAIKAFPANLPFGFEEEVNVDATVQSLRRTAEIWSELGKPENYVAEPAEDGKGFYIKVENPTAADADVKAAVQRSVRMNDQATLLLWVTDSLERRVVSNRMNLAEAIGRAQKLDRTNLFAEPHHEVLEHDLDRGAVSGVAAVALLCGGVLESADLNWAAEVTFRACLTGEHKGDLWHAGLQPLHHPSLYAVQGLVGLVRRNLEGHKARRAILTLAGHPLEEISAAAIGGALSLWDVDRRFAWCGLNLGVRLSIGEIRERLPEAFGYDHTTTPSRIVEAVKDTIAELESPEMCVSLERLPPPWEYTPTPPLQASVRGRKKPEPPIWRDPDIFLRRDFLPKVLKSIPIDSVMADDLRCPAFIAFCFKLVTWTIERFAPSWSQAESDFRDQLGGELHEWCSSVFRFLAQVALKLEITEVQRQLLDPIFQLKDKLATSLIAPLVDLTVCAGILDPAEISPQATLILERCIKRILQHGDWEYARRRDGDVYGFDLPDLIRVLLMVKVERADLAARFANGGWRNIQMIVPVIDPFVRAVGDIPSVMLSFLTLCERAHEYYRADIFVEQIGAILAKQSGTPAGWRNSTIPSRIAGLIQTFAEKSHPLPPQLAQAVLRILDRLVDMGDRRSAGLQTSEIFRDVRI